MPTNIAGDPTSFPTTITAPSDGDSDAGTTWQVPYGELADRTAYLKRGGQQAALNMLAGTALALTGTGGVLSVAFGQDPFQLTFSPDPHNWVGVGLANGTRATLVTSSDGLAWVERTAPAKDFDLNDVVYDPSNEVWIAVGEADGTDAYIITSVSITGTWTERSSTGNFTLNAVATNPTSGVSVAAGVHNGSEIHALRTTDGTTFSVITTIAGSAGDIVKDIWFASGLWVAVGESSAGAPLIWTSADDGVTWTPQTPTTGHTGELRSVTHNGTSWFTGSVDGEIASSTDGITWASVLDPSTSPADDPILGMASDPISGVIVATKANYVHMSANSGATWSVVPYAPSESWVSYGAGAFVLASYLGTMTSARSMVMV